MLDVFTSALHSGARLAEGMTFMSEYDDLPLVGGYGYRGPSHLRVENPRPLSYERAGKDKRRASILMLFLVAAFRGEKTLERFHRYYPHVQRWFMVSVAIFAMAAVLGVILWP